MNALGEKTLPADMRIFINGKEISVEEALSRLEDDMFLMQEEDHPRITLVCGNPDEAKA